MSSEGVKIRAQIDSETVRNVMLIYGGGSVALIAFLPNVLYTPLVLAVLIALFVWLFGLTLAVVHSILRRKCSLICEGGNMSLAQNRAFLSISSKEPWVCWWSWFTLYASIMAFLMGGVLMVIIGLANIDQLSSAPYNN